MSTILRWITEYSTEAPREAPIGRKGSKQARQLKQGTTNTIVLNCRERGGGLFEKVTTSRTSEKYSAARGSQKKVDRRDKTIFGAESKDRPTSLGLKGMGKEQCLKTSYCRAGSS